MTSTVRLARRAASGSESRRPAQCPEAGAEGGAGGAAGGTGGVAGGDEGGGCGWGGGGGGADGGGGGDGSGGDAGDCGMEQQTWHASRPSAPQPEGEIWSASSEVSANLRMGRWGARGEPWKEKRGEGGELRMACDERFERSSLVRGAALLLRAREVGRADPVVCVALVAIGRG